MYVALLVCSRTHFFKERPAVGRRAVVVHGWLLRVVPLVAGLRLTPPEDSHGVPGKIQISEATYILIKDDFVCATRGIVTVKGKGGDGDNGFSRAPGSRMPSRGFPCRTVARHGRSRLRLTAGAVVR